MSNRFTVNIEAECASGMIHIPDIRFWHITEPPAFNNLSAVS